MITASPSTTFAAISLVLTAKRRPPSAIVASLPACSHGAAPYQMWLQAAGRLRESVEQENDRSQQKAPFPGLPWSGRRGSNPRPLAWEHVSAVSDPCGAFRPIAGNACKRSALRGAAPPAGGTVGSRFVAASGTAEALFALPVRRTDDDCPRCGNQSDPIEAADVL